MTPNLRLVKAAAIVPFWDLKNIAALALLHVFPPLGLLCLLTLSLGPWRLAMVPHWIWHELGQKREARTPSHVLSGFPTPAVCAVGASPSLLSPVRSRDPVLVMFRALGLSASRKWAYGQPHVGDIIRKGLLIPRQCFGCKGLGSAHEG